MKLTYSHYSQEPLTLDAVRSWPTPKEIEQRPFKPRGLWLSVDGERDWAEWCQSEQFGIGHYRYRQQVTLTGKSLRHLFDRQGHGGVLHIDNAPDLSCFSEIYETRRYADGGIASLDWARVMERYDGIIIAPYQWSCRYDLMWYYPWDCASGCIWNTSVIQHVGEPIPVDWKQEAYSDE